MNDFEKYQSLIEKYEDQLQKDPRSRVFAPLSEIYRKMGLIDRALNILKDGIRFNPDYVLGFLGLAACYRDLNQYQLNYVMLKPLLHSNRDNIRLLKYFAESCEKTNNFDEALETYKFILFLNSKDIEVAEKVKNLEEKPALNNTIKAQSIDFQEEVIENSQNNPSIDDWILLDIGESQKQTTPKAPIRKQEIEIKNEKPKAIQADQVTPVITHTLVDLYLNQGHIEKALEILNKILLLNPTDEKTLKKKTEVELLVSSESHSMPKVAVERVEISEDQARENMLDIIDKKFSSANQNEGSSLLEERLWEFHKKLSNRSKNSDESL